MEKFSLDRDWKFYNGDFEDVYKRQRPGYAMSERSVGEKFEQIFKGCNKRIIVATFASNVHRVQQIIDAAAKNGRKVAVSGRSMENIEMCIRDRFCFLPACPPLARVQSKQYYLA